MGEVVAYLQGMFELARAGQEQGVLFWIAVYVAVVCAVSALRQWRAATGWVKTRGRLIEKGTGEFGASLADPSMQKYQLKALYSYVVDGRQYFGRKVSAWTMIASKNARFLLERQYRGIELFEDGTVSVYYHPARPEKSLLILPGLRSLLFTLTVGMLPAAYYVSRFVL